MSDYNVDTLENKIIVEASEAIKNIDQMIGCINKAKSSIDSIKNATGLKQLDNQAKKATSSLTKMQLIGKNLKTALNFTGIIYGVKKAFNLLTSSIENSVNYVETLNLFEVSMGKTLDQYGNIDSVSSKYYTKALNFQKQLNEAFGTNIEETMKYQALYNQMAESMGIGNNASYKMSENLTKLGIDLASLFNKDESATMEALRAGVLAGQTKPLRNYGLDVTQQSLVPILGELGIERSVKQLSQAEKMILRYIAVLRQASSAHGDFAKTIESPSNQLKVFKQQFAELKTVIGNFFQGLLGNIMPYINAVLMVIKEILKAIGSLFGFKVSSSNSNLASKTGIDDLNDGLGSAVGSAKELKAQLTGFDEINNITEDTSSGGSGGGISSTGIDSKLLDAMQEYDNLMVKVKMKATDIRDKIMDWLGFTKKINPLTGEVSFELNKGWTNLEKIWAVMKGIIGLAIAVKVVKLIGNLTNLWNILKKTKTATNAFGIGLNTIKTGLGTTSTWLKLGVEQFGLYRKAGDSVTASLGKTANGMFSLINPAVKATAGIAGLGLSMYGSYDAMKDYSEGTKTAGETTGQLAISIGGATASGALLGSVIPGIGTAIGAVIGAVLGLGSAIVGYQTETELAIKKNEEFNKSIQDSVAQYEYSNKIIEDNAKQSFGEVEQLGLLKNKLSEVIDENGKLKAGYEERAKVILNDLNNAMGTEFELNDLIKGDYEDITKKIDEVINKKKASALINLFEDKYTEALKNEEQAILNESDALNKLKEAYDLAELDNRADDIVELYGEWDNLTESQKSAYGSFDEYAKKLKDEAFWWDLDLGKSTKDAIKHLSEQDTAYRDSAKLVKDYTQDKINYSSAYTAYENGNTSELEYLWNKQSVSVQDNTNKIDNIYSQQIRNIKQKVTNYKDALNEQTGAGKEATEQLIKQQEQQLEAVSNNLIEQTKQIGASSPEIKQAWLTLAETSYDTFTNKINDLPEHLKTEVLEHINKNLKDETPNTGLISSELGEAIKGGIESAVPGVENASENIKNAITKNLDGTFSINFGLNANYSELKNKLVTMRDTISKMASIPIVGSAFTKYKDNIQSLINQLSVAGYAQGGFPDMGEIFMAREAGPELVGKIGSRTAVANNGQIVEALKLGVYEAVIKAMPQTGNTKVELDIRADEGIIVKKASKGFTDYVTQTGELPFPVPV